MVSDYEILVNGVKVGEVKKDTEDGWWVANDNEIDIKFTTARPTRKEAVEDFLESKGIQ